MADSITPAKLTKTTFRGVHTGWESQDGTMYAHRMEDEHGHTGEWEVRRASEARSFAVCYSLQHARVVIAEWIAERSPGQLEDDLIAVQAQREIMAKINSGS